MDDTLRGLFEEEAAQELAGIEALLDHAADPAAAPALYRHAHTIKGSAAVMGMDDVARLAKALEAIFDDARSGGRPVAEHEVPVIRAVVADLRYVVSGVLMKLDVSGVVADAEAALAALASEPSPAPSAPAAATGDAGLEALMRAIGRAQLTLMRHAVPAAETLPEYEALRALLGEDAAATPAPAPSGGRRALVVEDSPLVREHHRRILADAGFDVRVAEDGADALDVLGAWAADVVVTDVEMPRMDGIALTETLRGDARLADTPVLMVTSRADSATRRRGAQAGADDYLVKRVDRDALLSAVARVLEPAA